MPFYVYENWTAKNIKVHKAACSFCNKGNGVHPKKHGNKNGKWHGPFGAYRQARAKADQLANNLQTNYRNCKKCNPEI